MKAIGIGIMVIGIVVMGVAVAPSFGNIGGGSDGKEVCDLVGTMTGKVRDANFGKDVVDVTLNMNKANCRPASIFDGVLSLAALLSPGEVDITAVLFDSAQERVADHKFKVTTSFGEVEKTFSEDIKFKALEHGTYKVKIYTTWAGSQPVKEFTFTV